MSRRTSSSPPEWYYVVAAVVAVAALLWGVVSYFIPKAEPAKATTEPRSTVTASGNDSVAVGKMSGGTITKGAEPPPNPAK